MGWRGEQCSFETRFQLRAAIACKEKLGHERSGSKGGMMISFRVFVVASTFMLSLGVAGLQFSPSSGNEQPQVLPKNRFSMTISAEQSSRFDLTGGVGIRCLHRAFNPLQQLQRAAQGIGRPPEWEHILAAGLCSA
jgi:hypothetical protein